jgi:FKBP-type peptidyl-prolyl cis-trans isomerase
MKKSIVSSALMLATSLVIYAEEAAPKKEQEAVATTPAAPVIDAATLKKNTSYGFGFQNGRQFAGQVGRYGIGAADIDSELFLKGFIAGLANKKPEVAEKEIRDAMQALGTTLEAREKEIASKNAEAEKTFLAENGKKKGVTTTKSGLQYEVMTKGGDKKYEAPKETKDKDGKVIPAKEEKKQFMVNYRGTLLDGTEFDKSPEGSPVPMTLDVVPGFKEAITTMPIGAKWKLFIPASLAYGDQRRSYEIAPNSTLIFELELVAIEDAPPAPEGQGGIPIQMPEGVEPPKEK